MLCFASSSTANSSYACLYLPGDYPYPGSVSSSLKTVLTPSDNVSIAFSEDFYLFCMRFIGSSSSFFRCMNTTSEVDFTLSFAFPLAVAESKISIIPLPPSQGVYGISEALRQHPTPSTVLYHLQVQNLIDNTQDAYNSPSSFSWAFPYSAPPPFNPLSVSTLPVRNGSRTDIYAVATGGHAAGIIGMSIPQPNPGLVPFPVTGSPLVVSASLAESVLTCAHAPGSGFAFAMRHSVPGNTSGGTIVTRTTMTTALLSIEIFNTSKSFATVVVSTASIDYEYTFDVARSLMSTNVKEYVDNTPAPFFYSARSPNGDYFVTARCSNSTSSCSLSPYLVLANGLFPLNKTVVSLLPGRDASQAKFAINNQGRLRMAYIVKRTSPPPDLYYLEFVAFEAAYKQTLFSERFIGGSGPYSFLDFQVGPGPDPLSCAAISPSNLLVCAKTNLPTSLSNPLFSHTFPPELTDVKFRMGIPSLSTAPTAPTTLCPPAQQVSCTLAGNVNVTSGETVINLPSMIGGSLFISSTLTVSNSLSVGGLNHPSLLFLIPPANLSLASTSLLVITPQASSSPITVSGCANLAGQLVVEVPPTATVGDNSLTVRYPLPLFRVLISSARSSTPPALREPL